MPTERDITTLPTNATAHRTVTRIDSTNIQTATTVSKLRCNCGHETIFYPDIAEAREDMQLHHDLVNSGKIPEHLLCKACQGKAVMPGGNSCMRCEGTGIRRDISSSINQNGFSNADT